MVPELEWSEHKRLFALLPRDLGAWDCALQGLACLNDFSEANNLRAKEMFARALALDPDYGRAHAGLAFAYHRDMQFDFAAFDDETLARVGRELGVRYVVEGSVRKTGNRVRITVQLIYAASGNHLWADRFDGALDDIFDLQDRICEQIVIAVEPEIMARERERARRRLPENLDAWAMMQRGSAMATGSQRPTWRMRSLA